MSILLKLIMFNLNVTGLNPFKQNKFSLLLNAITFTGTFLFFVIIFLELLLNWQGLETLAKVYVIPAIFVILAKFYSLRIYNVHLGKLFKASDLFWPLDKHGADMNNKLNFYCKIPFMYLVSFAVGAYFLILLLFITPFVIGDKSIPFEGYAICDVQVPPCFEIQACGQTFTALGLMMPILIGIDGTFLYFITRAFCSIELIKFSVKQLDISSKSFKRDIKEIIDQHTLTIRFIGKIDNFYRTVNLVQLWASLFNLIFCLYMLTTEGIPPPTEFILKYGVLYLLFASQLLTNCIAGMLITEQTKTIADEAFYVNWWTETNSSSRKSLAQIIQVSQRGEKLTVGKLLELNLETFVTVLKNSLSMYMLLRTIESSTRGKY